MEPTMRNTLLTALLALVFGFLGAAAWSYAGLADTWKVRLRPRGLF